jgi:hypothetical protein
LNILIPEQEAGDQQTVVDNEDKHEREEAKQLKSQPRPGEVRITA